MLYIFSMIFCIFGIVALLIQEKYKKDTDNVDTFKKSKQEEIKPTVSQDKEENTKHDADNQVEDSKINMTKDELIATSNIVQGYTGSINLNAKDEEVEKYSSPKYIVKDNYQSKEYYLKKLYLNNQFINQLKLLIEKNKIKNYDSFYFFLAHHLECKIYILYVIGAESDIIKENIKNYKNVLKLKNQLTYVEIVNLMSLYYLYNLNFTDIEFIKLKMLNEKYVDAILDLLRNTIFENKVITTKDFYLKEKMCLWHEYKKDSEGLMNVFSADSMEQKNKEFKKYLDEVKTKYYNKIAKEFEIKMNDDGPEFVEIIDFKLTAIAKMLKIDRNFIADSKFIASDLL